MYKTTPSIPGTALRRPLRLHRKRNPGGNRRTGAGDITMEIPACRFGMIGFSIRASGTGLLAPE